MKSLTSIIFLSVASYICFIDKTEPYLNILMVYSIICFILSPFVIVGSAQSNIEELKANLGNLPIKKFFSFLWIFIWLRMITLDYTWTGAMGSISVICCFMAVNEIERRLKEASK